MWFDEPADGDDRDAVRVPRRARRSRSRSLRAVVVVVGIYPQLFARIGELARSELARRPMRVADAIARAASTARARSRSTRSSSSRSTAEGGFFAPGARRRARRARLRHQPRGRPAVRRVVARALDGWWRDARRARSVPRGRGRRGQRPARRATCSRAAPECARALRYVLVERSAGAARRRSASCSRSSRPTRRSGRSSPRPTTTRRCPVAGIGPVVTALDELPARRARRRGARQRAARQPAVRDRRAHAHGGGSRCASALDGDAVRRGARAREPTTLRARGRRSSTVPTSPPARGCRSPRGVDEWLRGVRGACCGAACSCVVDYVDDRARSWSTRGAAGWLRTYRGHDAGRRPLDAPGEQDITADVVASSTSCTRPRARASQLEHDVPQAEWLRGLGHRRARGRGPRARGRRAPTSATSRRWPARSRVTEAAALTDPAGLGAHRVLVVPR